MKTSVERLALSVSEAAALLGVSRPTMYQLLRREGFPAFKVGSRTLQIVSGIRKYYTPEEMVGKKVMVLTNLSPAKLAGVLSEGMILCASDAEGNLSLMVPEKDMPAGAEIS